MEKSIGDFPFLIDNIGLGGLAANRFVAKIEPSVQELDRVHEQRFSSFQSLKRFLIQDGPEEFDHRTTDGDRAVKVRLPKYLFRGEPGIYPSTKPSFFRLGDDPTLHDEVRVFLGNLLHFTITTWGSMTGDYWKSQGWAQHYGMPTTVLDVTHNPSVALHFAASGGKPKGERVVFRINFERAIREVEAAYLGSQYCDRGRRQAAWGLVGHSRYRNEHGWDLQRYPEIDEHVDHLIVDGADCGEYLIPGLLEDRFDPYATYPVAILRGFKWAIQRPFPPKVAKWICSRTPRFDWIPCDVHFGFMGLTERVSLRVPAAAEEEDGRSYSLPEDELVDELVGERLQTPNPVLFAMLRGRPFSKERLGPGSRFDVVMWKGDLPEVPFGGE